MALSEIKQAQVVLKHAMQFEATTGSGFTLSLDSAPEHGGVGAGARPMELILVGLAGCTAMDVASILRKMNQGLVGLEVHVRGTRAVDHPRVYTKIHLTYLVRGENVDPQAVERAIHLSESKYCSATVMLAKTAEITTDYTIET